MTYNKKQMQPLIDKYAINPETNKLFISICEMFDEQPNYQLWAVKTIFSKVMTIDELERIHEWLSKNQAAVKSLEKQNIVSYSNKTAIAQLFKEMEGIERLSLVKNTISHFNTEQRKMLNDAIFSKELSPLAAHQDKTIKKWYEIFKKFNRLPFERKNKFYSNCSRLKNTNDLLLAIESCLEETYKWNKEDFLAFMYNNTPDCEVVLDNDCFVIIHVPSFKSSKLLCGNGRTSWCITQQENYFRQYVTDYSNHDQYFLFDFSRKESDAFAHIGFTMENGRGFYCAQTCNNQDMRNGYAQGTERMDIKQALNKAGAKMSIFLRLNPLNEYSWDYENILMFIKKCPNSYAIAYEKDGRLVINILDSTGFRSLCGHTLINNFGSVDANNKTYVFIDTNLKVNDERSMIAMSYRKDEYGVFSLNKMLDPYNTDITKSGYLSGLGISSDCYLNREAIDPKVLLHKYIDENDEVSAIKLIEKEGKNLDVNFNFNQRIPIISAINQRMYNLFDKIINHPTFDSSAEDGFGETLLESLIYLYGGNEVSVSSKHEEVSLKRLILLLLKSETYDFNAKDINEDTALTAVCEFPSVSWIVNALVSKRSVDVNVVNDFKETPISICIRKKNLEALKAIGQRPDLKVRNEDKETAKAHNINLNDYIKPNENIFNSFIFEGEYAIESKEKTNSSEFEMAISSLSN